MSKRSVSQLLMFPLRLKCYSTVNREIKGIIKISNWLERRKNEFEWKTELGRNPPEVWVTSGQKPRTKIIYMVLQTSSSRALLNIFSKQFISSNTKRRKRTLNFIETLESFGKMKLMMKFFPCFHKISELWKLFSLVPVGNCFRCNFRQLFMNLALRKCKNDHKILKITLVQIFVL